MPLSPLPPPATFVSTVLSLDDERCIEMAGVKGSYVSAPGERRRFALGRRAAGAQATRTHLHLWQADTLTEVPHPAWPRSG